jgi:exosome complex RNA-binding protein Rrp4
MKKNLKNFILVAAFSLASVGAVLACNGDVWVSSNEERDQVMREFQENCPNRSSITIRDTRGGISFALTKDYR